MKNSKTLFQDFTNKITLRESKAEISDIAFLVFENLFNLSKTDILANAPLLPNKLQQSKLTAVIQRINNHEPVQYILGEAQFLGRKFKVDNSVLIPRPETEELVRDVKLSARKGKSIKILDIGTGSGCIAITLALEITGAEVSATDISEQALQIARQNADKFGAEISFVQHDILKENISFQDLDVIVSNPPYVTIEEKGAMSSNVIDYEPHLALFVPDDDALVFYKAIIARATSALRKGGLLCMEINEKFGKGVSELLFDSGFKEVLVLKDLSGKERIVKGVKVSMDE